MTWRAMSGRLYLQLLLGEAHVEGGMGGGLGVAARVEFESKV